MATPMMPDAPEPQNRMMAPQAEMAAPAMAAGPNAMMAAPQEAPAATPPTAEQVTEARQHLGAIVAALSKVASKPRGHLTKKDVYDAASDMIAEGGFPTAQSKQDLVVQLAKMPDDEPGIRSAIGRMLLRVTAVRSQFHQVHGEG